MDQIETNLVTTKPKRRWYQYRLKTLLLLPVVVGLVLVLYLYWDDWRKQRPPFKNNVADFQAACNDFLDDLKAGRLDHAYESTSVRFRERTSRSDFDTTISSFLAVWHGPASEEATSESAPNPLTHLLSKNRYEYGTAVKGPNRNVIELWAWLVNDDSFFYRQPPPPRVEEVQIREIGEADWNPFMDPSPQPSWEQK